MARSEVRTSTHPIPVLHGPRPGLNRDGLVEALERPSGWLTAFSGHPDPPIKALWSPSGLMRFQKVQVKRVGRGAKKWKPGMDRGDSRSEQGPRQVRLSWESRPVPGRALTPNHPLAGPRGHLPSLIELFCDVRGATEKENWAHGHAPWCWRPSPTDQTCG